jgi:hypothetical protein
VSRLLGESEEFNCDVKDAEEDKPQPIPHGSIRGTEVNIISQLVVVVDNRADFVKFLVDELGFRQTKVDQLVAHHADITSADDFFSYYALETEDSMQSHEFAAEANVLLSEDVPDLS